MLIQEVMTPNPVVVSPETSVPDALGMMRDKKIRRMPVVEKSGKLVGIVSEKDLLYASPSPATSLSVFEINSLIARITVESVMTGKVITIGPDMPIENAARVMADERIGGLPVLDSRERLIGIVTETNLFHALLELLGGRRPGVRVEVRVPGAKGTFARVAGAISAAGGDIVGLGVNDAPETGSMWHMTFKVQDISREDLSGALKKAGIDILDIRNVKE